MGSVFQLALYAFGGCVLGVLIGWSIQFVRNRHRIGQLASAAKAQLDEVVGQRNAFAEKCSKMQSRLEDIKAAAASRSAEFESAIEKSKLLAKNVQILRKERENTKSKLGSLQNALATFKQQAGNLQTEFHKTREFYKRELMKSLQKRKELEEDIVKARAEQEAFTQAVEASSLEHGSEENMVIAAQLRLGQLEVLERNIQKLEAENAELRQDARRIQEKFEAREKDLAQLEELRVHNRQLVQCVEALEDSRQAHEADAERYRQQADESEKLSDTLQLKLADLEQNFADMEKEQHEAIEDARSAAVVPILRKQG